MTSIIRTSDLTWFMADAEEQGEPPLRLILQIDNILDLICLYKQETDMTIKAVYVISTSDLNESGDWEMNKVSSIWTGIDIRYKQTIYFYSQTGDDPPYIVANSLAGLDYQHLIHARKLCTFPSGDE